MNRLATTSEIISHSEASPQEVDRLRALVATLQRDNLELRQQAGYWKAQHHRALQRLAALEDQLQLLAAQVRQLQDQQFGASTEKQSQADRSNTLEGFDEPEPNPDPDERTKKKPRVGPRVATTIICPRKPKSWNCPSNGERVHNAANSAGR